MVKHKKRPRRARPRTGRPRKSGDRKPCGRLATSRPSNQMTAELIAQRAIWVGEDNARDQRAALPLGQLLLANRITEDMWLAGMTLADMWKRWATMAEAPRRDAPAVGGTHPYRRPDEPLTDEDLARAERAWDSSDDRMKRARAAIRGVQHGELAMALVESLVVDEVMPPRLQTAWERRAKFDKTHPLRAWQLGWNALIAGLTALALELRITKPEVKADKRTEPREAADAGVIDVDYSVVTVPYVGRDGRPVLGLPGPGDEAAEVDQP